MTQHRLSVDNEVLPAALLATIKAQARVEHTRDDALLKSQTATAIGIVERKCNVSINPAEYVVTADELRCSPLPYGGLVRVSWRLPLNNAHEFTVVQSSADDAPDISADYELWNPDFGGNGSSYLLAVNGRAMPASAVLTLGVGIEDPAMLAPPFTGLIARLAASMYENREASSELWTDTFKEELIGMWRPTA